MQNSLQEAYTRALEMIMDPAVSDDTIHAQLTVIMADVDAEGSSPCPGEEQILSTLSERCAKFRPELMGRLVREFMDDHEQNHVPHCPACQEMKKAEETRSTKS